MVKYSGANVYTEVWQKYFFAKILGVIYGFSDIYKTRAHILKGKYEYIYFYVTASLRIFKKRTDDHQMSTRNDIYILIGGYNEMLFSETRDHPCAYVNRNGTINTIHIFNMDDISINPNRE